MLLCFVFFPNFPPFQITVILELKAGLEIPQIDYTYQVSPATF